MYYSYSTVHVEYFVANYVVEAAYQLGLRPNHITFLNCLNRLLIMYLIIYEPQRLAILLTGVILSQVLDCADGTMARRYNMGSKIGRIFDLSSDYIFGTIITATALYACLADPFMFHFNVIASAFFLFCCTANNASQGSDWRQWSLAEKLGRTFEEYV